MPQAKGLIRRVIAQSAPSIEPDLSDKTTRGFMRKLKIKRGDIDALRKIPPERIIEAQTEFMGPEITNLMLFRPLIDGDTIPKHPLKAFRDGDLKNIDFMIGTNLDEVKLFTFEDPTITGMVKSLGENSIIALLSTSGIDANKSREVLDIYKNARKEKFSIEPIDLLNAVATDGMFRIPTIRFLEAQSKCQPNTFTYMFTFPSPQFNGAFGCPHFLEIPFVFDSFDTPGIPEFVGRDPDIDNLSEKVMDAWIAFAHTGNPNHDGLPEWSSYDNKKRPTMILGKECKIENAPFDKEREAWDGVNEI